MMFFMGTIRYIDVSTPISKQKQSDQDRCIGHRLFLLTLILKKDISGKII